LKDLTTNGLGLAAISYDSPEILKAFAEKHGITFPLLSDPGSKTIAAWGILNKEATGRTAGIPHPGTYVIDRGGAIQSRDFQQAYQERNTASSILGRLSASTVRPGTTEIAGQQIALRLAASDLVAAPGHRLTLVVDVTPAKNAHVYAPGQTGYIPITLKLDPSADFKTAPAKYPASKPYVFAPLNETVQVYDRPFRITQDITLTLIPSIRQRATAGETSTITGTLESQACDDKVCFRPETLPVKWTIKLVPIVR
jgi:hypothetical protein